MVSYAQAGEDVILYHMLKKINGKIFYIDVGANDPEHLSVTKLFYELGNNGINIEPMKKHYEKLCQERKRDINLNIAVGNPSRNGGVIDVSYSEYGFFNKNHDYYEGVKNVDETQLKVVSLNSVCEEYVPRGQDIHFLKVDVDGFEADVLDSIDFQRYRPFILCVEVTVSDAWIGYINSNGYSVVYRDSLNAWFVADEKLNDGVLLIDPRYKWEEYLSVKYGIGLPSSYDIKMREILLSRMVELCDIGSNLLTTKLRKWEFSHIAVYGMGIIGELLVRFVKNIKIDYAIDRRCNECVYYSFPVYSIHDKLPNVDVVIITVTESIDEIENILNGLGLKTLRINELLF